jgi:hypothetical protein
VDAVFGTAGPGPGPGPVAEEAAGPGPGAGAEAAGPGPGADAEAATAEAGAGAAGAGAGPLLTLGPEELTRMLGDEWVQPVRMRYRRGMQRQQRRRNHVEEEDNNDTGDGDGVDGGEGEGGGGGGDGGGEFGDGGGGDGRCWDPVPATADATRVTTFAEFVAEAREIDARAGRWTDQPTDTGGGERVLENESVAELLYLQWRGLPACELEDAAASWSELPAGVRDFLSGPFRDATTPACFRRSHGSSSSRGRGCDDGLCPSSSSSSRRLDASEDQPVSWTPSQRNLWIGAGVTSCLHFDAHDNLHTVGRGCEHKLRMQSRETRLVSTPHSLKPAWFQPLNVKCDILAIS